MNSRDLTLRFWCKSAKTSSVKILSVIISSAKIYLFRQIFYRVKLNDFGLESDHQMVRICFMNTTKKLKKKNACKVTIDTIKTIIS